MEHADSTWRHPTYFFRPKFYPQLYLWNNLDMNSTGIGKTMVEFFSAEIVFNVCRYRSCIADGVSAMMSAASFRERDAVISPSAAITWKRVYLSNRPHFLWVYRRDNLLGMLREHQESLQIKSRRFLKHVSVFRYEFTGTIKQGFLTNQNARAM